MKQRADGRWRKVKTINGKQVTFYSTAKTERLALKDLENQMLEYSEKEDKGKTFKEVAKEWQETPKYTGLSPTTQKRYDTLTNYCINQFDGKYIKEITSEDIEDFLNYFVEQGKASKTIKHQFSVICLIFKYAKLKRYINSCETDYVTAPQGKKSVTRTALTDNEIKIVNNSIDCTFGLLAYFLLYTGLRRGELIALQWSDIDFENKLIYVTKSAYYVGDFAEVKCTKTTAGTRSVLLLDNLAKRLKNIKKTPSEYVFNIDGKMIRNTAFNRNWHKYQEETGITATAHQFRHTFATILFEAGIDVKDAQNIMGHADITTTRNIYTHIRDGRMNKTKLQLNNYIKENIV